MKLGFGLALLTVTVVSENIKNLDTEKHAGNNQEITTKSTKTPKKLITFREAMKKATGMPYKEEKRNVSEKNEEVPKAFFKVMRVHEKLMVNEKNETKGYNASLNDSLFVLQSGRLTRVSEREMRIMPKSDSPLLKGIDAQNFISQDSDPSTEKPNKPKKNCLKEFLRKWYNKLHLYETGPAVAAAIILGFMTTALIYMLAYSILCLYSRFTGYQLLARPNTSEDQLIRSEERRLGESRPLIRKT